MSEHVVVAGVLSVSSGPIPRLSSEPTNSVGFEAPGRTRARAH